MLRSVDDMIERFISLLDQKAVLDDTYFLFTADHVRTARLCLTFLPVCLLSACQGPSKMGSPKMIVWGQGYHLGEFGMLYDKRMLYETDIRVPLFVSGPGIKAGQVIESPVGHIE